VKKRGGDFVLRVTTLITLDRIALKTWVRERRPRREPA
jgi:hypothetical protein